MVHIERDERVAAHSLLTAEAVRERAHEMLAAGLAGKLQHVTIDLDRLEANIKRVQGMIAASGKGNRPHIKTHKIPAIAKMQMAAGAVGITCQKLGEARAFIDAGAADDILITFNIVGESKTNRLMELSSRVKRLAVVADNETVVKGLSEAGVRHGRDVV